NRGKESDDSGSSMKDKMVSENKVQGAKQRNSNYIDIVNALKLDKRLRFEYKRVVGGSKNENNLKGKGKEKVVLVRNESYNKVDNYKEMNKQEGKEHTTSNPKKEKGMKNMMVLNRFILLDSLVDESKLVPPIKEREVVDLFINDMNVPKD
ncbi:hypothetical protein Tco_0753501, partial [Tanacetum coccineum]